jgi:hypothetical protein
VVPFSEGKKTVSVLSGFSKIARRSVSRGGHTSSLGEAEFIFSGEQGLVRVNFREWTLEIERCPMETFTRESCMQHPLIRNARG